MLGLEVGGRFSREAASFLRELAKPRARESPERLPGAQQTKTNQFALLGIARVARMWAARASVPANCKGSGIAAWLGPTCQPTPWPMLRDHANVGRWRFHARPHLACTCCHTQVYIYLQYFAIAVRKRKTGLVDVGGVCVFSAFVRQPRVPTVSALPGPTSHGHINIRVLDDVGSTSWETHASATMLGFECFCKMSCTDDHWCTQEIRANTCQEASVARRASCVTCMGRVSTTVTDSVLLLLLLVNKCPALKQGFESEGGTRHQRRRRYVSRQVRSGYV